MRDHGFTAELTKTAQEKGVAGYPGDGASRWAAVHRDDAARMVRRTSIPSGHRLVRDCLAINRHGRYQILAAINAVHTDAPTAADTDWTQVLALYDQPTQLDPSPIVALNRAVAIAEIDGPNTALAQIDQLPLSG